MVAVVRWLYSPHKPTSKATNSSREGHRHKYSRIEALETGNEEALLKIGNEEALLQVGNDESQF